MAKLTTSRTEYLARRERIQLAAQGRDLLVDKRTVLMREFGELSREVLTRVDDLEEAATGARSALGWAVATDGPDEVRSAAMATGAEIQVDTAMRSVAGVKLVDLAWETVARPETRRGYSMAGTTAAVEVVADGFEAVLEALLRVAALEVQLRRLAREIERTSRQVNALEEVLIPRLVRERRQIALALEEREREERFRLSRMRRVGNAARYRSRHRMGIDNATD